jgi:hypothetical protein
MPDRSEEEEKVSDNFSLVQWARRLTVDRLTTSDTEPLPRKSGTE